MPIPGPEESQEQDLGELADALDRFGEDDSESDMELLDQQMSQMAESSGPAAFVEDLSEHEVDDLGRVVAEQTGAAAKADGITASAVMAAMGGNVAEVDEVVPPVLHEHVPPENQVTAEAVAEAVAASFGMAPPAEPAAPAAEAPMVAEMVAEPVGDAFADGGDSLLDDWSSDEVLEAQAPVAAAPVPAVQAASVQAADVQAADVQAANESAMVPALAMEQGQKTQIFYKPTGTASGRGMRLVPMDEDDFEEAIEDLETERVFDDHIKSMRLVGVAGAHAVEAAELGLFRRDR